MGEEGAGPLGIDRFEGEGDGFDIISRFAVGAKTPIACRAAGRVSRPTSSVLVIES